MRPVNRKKAPIGQRCVAASYGMTDAGALHGIEAHLMATAAETMRRLAAKKGRVLITPSIVATSKRDASRAATLVVVRTLTAPRPDWKRRRASEGVAS